MSMSQASRIAVITGAGSGIGAAGARPTRATLDRRLAGRRPRSWKEAPPGPGPSIWSPGDVTDELSRPASTRPMAKYGRLDVLFNNAGAGPPGRPIDESRSRNGSRWWT